MLTGSSRNMGLKASVFIQSFQGELKISDPLYTVLELHTQFRLFGTILVP